MGSPRSTPALDRLVVTNGPVGASSRRSTGHIPRDPPPDRIRPSWETPIRERRRSKVRLHPRRRDDRGGARRDRLLHPAAVEPAAELTPDLGIAITIGRYESIRGAVDLTDRRLTDTDRERMMLQAFRRHGIPDPVPQFVIRHNGLFIARVDAALPQYRLAFEYESYEWHTGRAALIRDTSRRNRLLAIGWPTIGVTAADLRSGGLVVCRQILEVIRRAS